MTSVSVVIPCFNAGPWVRETLESVLSQEIEDMETIAVDDGSTDDTARIIEKDFPSVMLIRTPNRGPGAARNIGTRVARGQFLQYLDADDLLAPGKIKIQLEELRKDGRADVAYGGWQKLVKTSMGWRAKERPFERVLRTPDVELFTDCWWPMAAYLFRRSIVEKVGYHREDLRVIQDARFALDCALHGARFVHCGGVMGYYRMHVISSVSDRSNPVGLIRDILQNAIEVEDWWRERGGITEERRGALLKVYGTATNSSFEDDKITFRAAFNALQRLSPGYAPKNPKGLAVLSSVFGYEQALAVNLQYKNLKRRFRNILIRGSAVDKTRFCEISCPTCGSGSYRKIAARFDSGRVVRCFGCGHAYLNPALTDEALKRIYEAYHADNEDLYMKAVEESFRDERGAYQHALNLAEKMGGFKDKRVLDVGCGPGRFVYECRNRGALAAGLEPSSRAVLLAKKNFGLELIQKSLEEAISDGAVLRSGFDMIFAFEIIEHVRRPAEFLRNLYRLLAPGGLLFVSTPNFYLFSLMGNADPSIRQCPEHLHYFEPVTLKKCVESCGFESLELITLIPKNFSARQKQKIAANPVFYVLWALARRARPICRLKDIIFAQLDKCPEKAGFERWNGTSLFAAARKPVV